MPNARTCTSASPSGSRRSPATASPRWVRRSARHYADALEAAPALAPLLGGLDRAEVAGLARRWLVAAADRDAARYATAAAADGYRRAIELTPDDDRLALAGLRRRLGAALATDDLDRAVEASLAAVADARAVLDAAGVPDRDVAEAREILAGAAVGAATGRYEQVRFAEALAIADEALAVLGDGPGSDRVALARIRAREGLDNDYVALAAEARAIADRVGGRRATTRASRSRPAAPRSRSRPAAGRSPQPSWRAFADEAVRLGRLDVAAGSLVNGATVVYEDDRAAAFDQLDRAEDLAERYALHDRLGWVGQTRTELCLATGDWDRATAGGARGGGRRDPAELPPDRRPHDGGAHPDRPRPRRPRDAGARRVTGSSAGGRSSRGAPTAPCSTTPSTCGSPTPD